MCVVLNIKCWEKSKTYINGSIHLVHELEDSMLLRCTFYTKWYIDWFNTISIKTPARMFDESVYNWYGKSKDM